MVGKESIQTTVVNIKTTGKGYSKIDRTTIYGNRSYYPKSRTVEEHQKAVYAYEKYFYERLESDPEFKAAVHMLWGNTLGCWCKPLPCHGDVIAEYLNSLEE